MRRILDTALTVVVIHLVLAGGLCAQSFTVKETQVEHTSALDEYPEMKTVFTNISGTRLHLKVSRTQNMPEGWESQICFFYDCYPADVSEKTGYMDADTTDDLKLGFYGLSTTGTGEVTLTVENLDNSAETVTVRYILTVESVSSVKTATPVAFDLMQNYPNPFNPSTTIDVDVQHPVTASLTVEDLLGREVARLADRQLFDAGRHSFTFDAGGITSGVYFYRLETEQVVTVKSMVLQK